MFVLAIGHVRTTAAGDEALEISKLSEAKLLVHENAFSEKALFETAVEKHNQHPDSPGLQSPLTAPQVIGPLNWVTTLQTLTLEPQPQNLRLPINIAATLTHQACIPQ